MGKIRKLFNCEQDDPDRCQGPGGQGEIQCRNLSIAGMLKAGYVEKTSFDVDITSVKYCPRHGAALHIESLRRKEMDMYKLTKWKDRVGDLASHKELNTLSNEIAIVRMTLEQILNQCNTEHDLLIYSHRITTLTNQVQSLLTAAERLAQRTEKYMDKGRVVTLVGRMLEIIGQEIKDGNVLDRISERISEIIRD